MKQIMKSTSSVVLGNLIYALTVKLFLLPGNLVTGGTTGIALTISHFWPIPISGFVLVFNIVMLVAGLLILGKAFAVTTLASSFLYPMFLELLNQILGDVVLTTDLLLCTVFTGLGVGVGLGLVIRSGSSTGGMDIPPLVLKKLTGIPVSVSMYFFDGLIILAQALFQPAENVLYGILLMIIYTFMIDKMILWGNSRTELKIVSAKHREISDAILTQIDRGVTLLDAEGGYLHQKTQMVMSIISNRELIKVEKLVREIDPECFMTVSRVTEVRGRGFSLNKHYHKNEQ